MKVTLDPIEVCKPEDLLADPGFPRLKALVTEVTGHKYYSDKDEDLARRLQPLLAESGTADCEAYWRLLQHSEHGAAALEALAGRITIGESFFFRHREHFDALQSIVFPDLAARNAASSEFSIWCAGCADGAEPYSVSILIRRDLKSLLQGWKVDILATDINRRALSAAESGRFEEWSFRANGEDLRNTCFTKEGKGWRIADPYRHGISFQAHNLARDPFPPVRGARTFDLIICRNVMIYFGMDLMGEVVQKFHGCLAPGGWLLVGPSEPNMASFQDFRAVNGPGVTLYQKPEEGPGVPVHAAPAFDFRPARLVEPPCSPAPVHIHHADIQSDLRRRMEAGDWDGALKECAKWTGADSLDPLAHLHRAYVLHQLGNDTEAERSLRRTLYLDRHSAPAHCRLGLLLLRRGDHGRAARCFANATELVATRKDDEVLADPGGMTVAALKESARSRGGGLGGQQ